MNWRWIMNWKALLVTATQVAALALAGCTQAATPQPATSQPATPQAATPKPAVAVHTPGAVHALQPKGLEAVTEIDMTEFAFSVPGEKTTPIFRIPAGKTVGLHLHNEGGVVHEVMIGRKPVKFVESEVEGKKVTVPDGYAKALFKDHEADLFFYYGESRIELAGATFEELEVDPGVRDIWIRVKFPPELAGEWEIGCFVPGHYEAGMRATLIVG
jgi:uncharacterized cupredoxin-like copper-binding protein